MFHLFSYNSSLNEYFSSCLGVIPRQISDGYKDSAVYCLLLLELYSVTFLYFCKYDGITFYQVKLWQLKTVYMETFEVKVCASAIKAQKQLFVLVLAIRGWLDTQKCKFWHLSKLAMPASVSITDRKIKALYSFMFVSTVLGEKLIEWYFLTFHSKDSWSSSPY